MDELRYQCVEIKIGPCTPSQARQAMKELLGSCVEQCVTPVPLDVSTVATPTAAVTETSEPKKTRGRPKKEDKAEVAKVETNDTAAPETPSAEVAESKDEPTTETKVEEPPKEDAAKPKATAADLRAACLQKVEELSGDVALVQSTLKAKYGTQVAVEIPADKLDEAVELIKNLKADF